MNNHLTLIILNRIFKIAAPTLFLISFSFEVNDRGELRILWRDNPPLAILLTMSGVLLGAAWLWTSRRLRGYSEQEPALYVSDAKSRKRNAPYNIMGEMETKLRLRFAIAVFLTFCILGPIILLTKTTLAPIPMVTILITTISSGGMAASFALFGHRKWLLALSFMFFFCCSSFADRIASTVFGAATRVPGASGAVTLSETGRRDIEDQRKLIGIVGIFLLAGGYAMWIVLLSKEGAKRMQYQTEVNVAQKIQRQLLPSGIVRTRWCEVSGITDPATDVGGDYFDVIMIDDNRLAVVIADVAGHGIGAGILSAMTKSALRSQILHDPSPVAVLQNVNATLHQVAERKMFVTLAYVLLDWNEKRACVATAGHLPVIHKSGSTIQEVRTQSLGLGMQRSGTFSDVLMPLAFGDSLCLYTDGVTEVVNGQREQFGVERLLNFVATNGALSVDAFTRNVLAEVKAFANKNELKDDATIVYVRLHTV